ncbi:MAG: hypothetical protein AAGF24_07065 [Cyanobacteria bacterium P01_H01_bin.121]
MTRTSAPPAPTLRQEPIPPPSEPMQFRAIGLVKGRYIPSEEQVTRGLLVTADGQALQTVLLGRVLSLVKKYLNLDDEHLWVVYPRTPDKSGELYLQVVGIWEPETLQQPSEANGSELDKLDLVAEAEEAAAIPKIVPPKLPVRPTDEMPDGYFSVRGEVIFQAPEKSQVAIKIKQAPRKNDTRPRSFKLQLQGQLEGRALHQFWDLKVLREGNALSIHEAACVGMLPPKKVDPKFRGQGRKPIRGGGGAHYPKKRGMTGSPKPRIMRNGSDGSSPSKAVPRPVKVKKSDMVNPEPTPSNGSPQVNVNQPDDLQQS